MFDSFHFNLNEFADMIFTGLVNPRSGIPMPPKEDEYALIAQAVSGDIASLEMLLFRYRNRLLAYVQAHLPTELRGFLEPQDVVQDTWLKAIRAIGEFRPAGSEPVYRWLVTISRNLILDQAK